MKQGTTVLTLLGLYKANKFKLVKSTTENENILLSKIIYHTFNKNIKELKMAK